MSFVVVWVVYGALDPLYTLQHLSVLPQRYLDSFVSLHSPWRRCAQVIPGAHVLQADTPRSRVHGWVGISATDLSRGWDPWLGAFRPLRELGGTEVVYRIPRPR